MALDVIGAGFGRTGTLSLKFALEKLGFDKCYHMMEVRQHPEHIAMWSAAHRGESVDWDALYAGYRATVDWPSCNLWEAQLAHFPDAKVILSHRDPEAWYDSIMATIYKSSSASLESDQEEVRASGAWAFEIIWDRIFDGRLDDRAHVIEVFNRHNEDVRRKVPADKLLEYQPGDGWAPLCKFLGVDVPNEPYPKVNSTAEFTSRWEQATSS